MSQPAPVLLLTSWHLRRMRSMPRAFWDARALERATRRQPGCAGIHRWVSRRSILLESRWQSRAAADAWLASPAFRAFDARVRSIPDAEARVELRDENAPRA